MNEETTMDRRSFLRLGMTTGVAAFALAQGLPKFSWADTRQTSLSDCLQMSAQDMAQSSKIVKDSWVYIEKAVSEIQDPKLRGLVSQMLESPVPTFAAHVQDNKGEIYRELTAKGLLKDITQSDFLPPLADRNTPPQSFLCTPGSGYGSHHAYPGGVVTHTALNLKVALAISAGYQTTYGYDLDQDVVIASQALHDLHKAWVFQWGKDSSSRNEMKLAGTGEHHVYSVAESITRGLPSEICVAQACAHNHPGSEKDEQQVVGWLQAAAILAGTDPVERGLLAPGGKTLPLPRRMENFVCHLGDHDWVLTVPAVQWLLPEMQAIARTSYKMPESALQGKMFNNFRNYVFSQATAMTLYHEYTIAGKKGLAKRLTALISPV